MVGERLAVRPPERLVQLRGPRHHAQPGRHRRDRRQRRRQVPLHAVPVAGRLVAGGAHQRLLRRHRGGHPDEQLPGQLGMPSARAARGRAPRPTPAAGGRGPRRAGTAARRRPARPGRRRARSARPGRRSSRAATPSGPATASVSRARSSEGPRARRRRRPRRSAPPSRRRPRCRRAASVSPGASARVSARSVTVSTHPTYGPAAPELSAVRAARRPGRRSRSPARPPTNTTISSSPSRTAVSKSPRVSASRA